MDQKKINDSKEAIALMFGYFRDETSTGSWYQISHSAKRVVACDDRYRKSMENYLTLKQTIMM